MNTSRTQSPGFWGFNSLLSGAFGAALAFLLAFASPAWAASGPTTIDLNDHSTASGTDWNYASGVFTITGSTAITVTSPTAVADGTRIVIDDGVTANLTFDDVSIMIPTVTSQSPVTVSTASSTLNLTITGTLNNLVGGDGAAGISVESGATLVIGGSGTLRASGAGGGAGIGGASAGVLVTGGSCGTVTIGDSATVIASGGSGPMSISGGAGIGGGGGSMGGTGGTVTITGNANVTATGADKGAGIGGGGGGGTRANTTINTTGLVTASGGSDGNGHNGANIGDGASTGVGTDISNSVGCFVVSASVSGGNGSISPLGSWSVNRGDMSFGIQADSGYAIDKITDGSTDVTGTQAGMMVGSYALTGISANHTLVVSFVLQLSLTPSSLPNGTVGTAYSVSIAGDASGGVPPYAGFSLAAGSTLPAGLSLASDGTISGTPTTAVAGASFSVTVTDADSDTATASYTITIASSTPPGPGPAPSPVPTPTPEPPFSDGGSLSPGGSYSAPAGDVSFCLGSAGSAPVRVRIDNVPYTITPEAENTCFEIFGNGNARDLILDSGSAEISSIVPGAILLEARNGDLVTGNGRIRATVDPVCTSTRVMILEGNVKAPEWILAPPPNTGCPADALTPQKGSFMASDGKLACPPSALSIKGTWAKLTVKHTQPLAAGQQLFAVAGHPVYGWFQNNGQGWMPLSDPFLPIGQATQTGSTTSTPVDRLDVRPILGTELYMGNGKDAEEMMRNGRYCGAFKVTP